MRIYLPATLPLLAEWVAAGRAPAGAAHAVTPALREWYREGDQEELEYAAQVAAGRASLGLLAADPAAPRRRVVVAADVADADVATVDQPRSAVVVGVAVPASDWGSALVDAEDADGAVSIAASALARADAGDDDAVFAVDDAQALELAWYAVQELPDLLR